MTNVLIVGGAGYVGGGITDRLAAAGYRVRVYGSSRTPTSPIARSLRRCLTPA